MILLVEGPLESDHADNDRLGLVAAAKALGHRVHVLPSEHELEPGDARIPGLTRGDFEWGLLYGDIPTPERYQRVHDEARALNITLLNELPQHLDAQELHRTVRLLDGLTARTRWCAPRARSPPR